MRGILYLNECGLIEALKLLELHKKEFPHMYPKKNYEAVSIIKPLLSEWNQNV